MKRASSATTDATKPPDGLQGGATGFGGDTGEILRDNFGKLPSQIASSIKSAFGRLFESHADFSPFRGTSGSKPLPNPFAPPPLPKPDYSAFAGPPKPASPFTAFDAYTKPSRSSSAWAFDAFGPGPKNPASNPFGAFDSHVKPVVGPPAPSQVPQTPGFDAFKGHASPVVGPPAPKPPWSTFSAFDAYTSQFVGPPAPNQTSSNPFSAFGAHAKTAWPYSAFGQPPPPTSPSGGNPFSAFSSAMPPPFVGPPAPPSFVGPPAPTQMQGPPISQRNRPDAPFFATIRRAYDGGIARGKDGVREFNYRADMEIGRVIGRDTLAAFTKVNRVVGEFASVFQAAASPVGKSVAFAEGVNDQNRRFQGYNPAITMGYARLAIGDMQRTMSEGKANQKAIVNLTDSINGMRQAYLPFDTARTGVLTRLAGAGAEIGRIAGRDLASPVADWVNRRLEANDPNGDLAQQAIRYPQAKLAQWIAQLLPPGWGGGQQAGNIAFGQMMKPPQLPMDNAWGMALWEMKNVPIPLNPPMVRKRPAGGAAAP